VTALLSAGIVAGAIIGLFHAGYVYRVAAVDGHLRASYHALWTVGLWLLFGPMMLTLWIISAVACAIARPFRWRM
jgi:hypothetical protein